MSETLQLFNSPTPILVAQVAPASSGLTPSPTRIADTSTLRPASSQTLTSVPAQTPEVIDSRQVWHPSDAPTTTRYASSDVEKTVLQWYRTLLGRDPDTEGWATWVRNITTSGAVTAYAAFFGSDEAKAFRVSHSLPVTPVPTPTGGSTPTSSPTPGAAGGGTDSTGGATASGQSIGDLLNSMFGTNGPASPPLTAAPTLAPVTQAAGGTPWLMIAVVGALAVGAYFWYKHSHAGA